MPENTVSVTRPGKWGNPFIVGGWYKIGNGKSGFAWLRCYDEKLAKEQQYTQIKTKEECIEWYKKYRELYPLNQKEISELKGKDLACWCKVGDLCHADIILEIVNS